MFSVWSKTLQHDSLLIQSPLKSLMWQEKVGDVCLPAAQLQPSDEYLQPYFGQAFAFSFFDII